MWNLSINISHCLVLSPVNENMPIWSVMWFHVPGVLILSNSYLSNFLILIILWATSSLNYVCHSAKFYLLFKTLATIRAPCIGGLEYIFLAIILKIKYNLLYLRKDFFTCFFVSSNKVKGSNSLSIKTDIFGKRLSNNHLESFWNKVSDWPSILLKISSCESLIGWIKERNQRVLFHDSWYFFPLLLSWVNTCWIMSTCME